MLTQGGATDTGTSHHAATVLLAWLTPVVTTPRTRLRVGAQKRQVPADGALPRRFVSPRGRVRHSLSVGSEEHRRVPASGARVWLDVIARYFALLALHPRSGATHHAAVQLSRNAHSTAMEAVPADLDASRRIVRREPGRVNAQRGLSVSGDEDPGTARRSVGGCYPPMREPEGSHAADAETFFTKLARSTYPQVRGGHDEGSSDGSTRRSTTLPPLHRMPLGWAP